jgi:hypothetical protein
MSDKSKLKPDDPDQSKRFIEIAEQVGADNAETLETAFKKLREDEKTKPIRRPYENVPRRDDHNPIRMRHA